MADYRRYSNPWILDVSPTSANTQVAIASDPRYPGIGKARSFEFQNCTASYVRLRGSSQEAGGFVAVTATTGWLIKPFGTIIRASQRPDWISVMSVDYAGIPAATGKCEINYGTS